MRVRTRAAIFVLVMAFAMSLATVAVAAPAMVKVPPRVTLVTSLSESTVNVCTSALFVRYARLPAAS